jgi:VanZ family protein
MKRSNIVGKSSLVDLNKFISQWTIKIIISSFTLILFSTLFPFNFLFENSFFVKEIASKFETNSSNLSDQIGNIWLFLPLGFGLSGLLQERRLGVSAKLAIIFIICASLSSTVEVLQAFLPERASTISDIITNTIGGGLGFMCFHLWRYTIIGYILGFIERLKNSLSSKKLAAGFIGYIVLLCLISPALPNAMNLKNWDTTFPLVLGNERTGNRSWQGYISELYIGDRAISENEVARFFSDKRSFASIGDSLIASYQLAGQGSNCDQAGHLPELSWRGQPPNAQDGKGVFLASSHWLETATPATYLSQKIRETSQFTLNVIVATADITQSGPARIVSLSSGPDRRNLTIGQDKTDLVFRLRTPISGVNGTHPEIVVPGLFADTNFHHIIITYDGLSLQIYTDKLENLHSFEITPMSYKVFYYELIFIPLGCLLSLILTLYKRRFTFYIFLLFGGVLLPSLLVEGILASASGRSLNLANLATSLLVTTGTLMLFTVKAPTWLPKKAV